MGLSDALESRLRAAERTRDELRKTDVPAQRRAMPTPEAIALACRRMVMNLRECLDGDIARARTALQSMLGEIRLVAEGEEVYAEVETRADRLLLKAVGAGVSNSGCGDRI